MQVLLFKIEMPFTPSLQQHKCKSTVGAITPIPIPLSETQNLATITVTHLNTALKLITDFQL